MKKILIIGGSGTVGTAFIRAFYDKYHFVSFARDEKQQQRLQSIWKRVEYFSGEVEDLQKLLFVFETVKPDIVIHTAAVKDVVQAEKCPSAAVNTNLIGTLNVIKSSQATNVPITIGVSSDKAASRSNVYSCTKYLMERLFIEADNAKNKFICCRLSNIAGAKGSVIPHWLNLA